MEDHGVCAIVLTKFSILQVLVPSTAAVCGLLSILQNEKIFDREAMERAKTNGSRELSIIYCGMKTNWNKVIPIFWSDLAVLGKIEVIDEMEDISKEFFNQNIIDDHYAKNINILKKGLKEQNKEMMVSISFKNSITI